MGEENIEKQNEIKEKKNKIDELNKEIAKYENKINEFDNDKRVYRNDIEDKCWHIQKQYGEEFKSALTGSRSSKKNFCDK